jgi:hypothetical protein
LELLLSQKKCNFNAPNKIYSMADEMSFWKRVQSESPRFFVRIQNIAIWMGAVSSAAIAGLAVIPDFTIPDSAMSAYKYIMVASVVAGVIAKTPIKDANDTPKQ